MKIRAVTFTLLTVGSAEPVAKGSFETEPDGERFHFSLCWNKRTELQVDFVPEFCQRQLPTQRELNELKRTILYQYSNILRRALYGSIRPAPRTVLSANLKALRLGHEFARTTAACRLNVRDYTISSMENGSFDLDADIWKYVDPADSLLFRAAKSYHVPECAVWELSSPHFFLRHWIPGCSYDFGSKPFVTKLYPFRRFNTGDSQ